MTSSPPAKKPKDFSLLFARNSCRLCCFLWYNNKDRRDEVKNRCEKRVSRGSHFLTSLTGRKRKDVESNCDSDFTMCGSHASRPHMYVPLNVGQVALNFAISCQVLQSESVYCLTCGSKDFVLFSSHSITSYSSTPSSHSLTPRNATHIHITSHTHSLPTDFSFVTHLTLSLLSTRFHCLEI